MDNVQTLWAIAIPTAREKYRIEIYIEIYKKMDYLTQFFNDSEESKFSEQINLTNSYIVSNKIFMDKKLFNICQDFLDYFKENTTNYSNRDLLKEKHLRDKFIEAFNSR